MMIFSPAKAALLICIPLTLFACKTGFNRTPDSSDPDTEVSCDQSISNASASTASTTTLAIFNNLARLSCGDDNGLIMGQSLGSGNQLVSDDQDVSYDALINDLKLQPSTTENSRGAGGTAALISLDYEFDRIYTEAEIDAAHNQIQIHWNDNGLISISWTPLNPWVNEGNDFNNLGAAEDTAHTEDVDLAELLDNTTPKGQAWDRRLTFIANQLNKLDGEGITVLWRPFPEMNSEKFWYGAANIGENASDEDTEEVQQQIRNLWIDMYNFFANQDLDNLIWVYSPAERDFLEDTQAIDWAFPFENAENETGTDRYVDIVAPVVLDDNLLIDDYDELLALDRPLAAARLTPRERSGNDPGDDADGEFDNEAYTDIIESRRAIAYWVSWHNYTVDGTKNIFSLVDNQNTEALVDNDDIITLEKLGSRNFRTTNTSSTGTISSN